MNLNRKDRATLLAVVTVAALVLLAWLLAWLRSQAH